MRTFFHRHAADYSTHGIDLAPMLDFVTNLLIFFIITAVFVKQTGVDVNRPTRIIVAAHERAPTGALVAVVDEVHLGGISDITFTTTR
jgi:biopolymer transport protein ExbD